MQIAGIAVSMLIALVVILLHPYKTDADRVSMFKFISLWVLIVSIGSQL